MRHRLVLSVILLGLLSIQPVCAAQPIIVNFGINGLFQTTTANITLQNTDIALLDNAKSTNYELYGAVYVPYASFRGYYQPQKTFTADITLPESFSKDKKILPVSSTFTTGNYRLELVVPLRVNRQTLIEPTIVYQVISQTVSLTGKDYSCADSQKLASGGVGAVVTENISRNTTLIAKFFVATDTSLFDIRYLLHGRMGFVGLGYRQHRLVTEKFTIKTAGPAIEIGLMF